MKVKFIKQVFVETIGLILGKEYYVTYVCDDGTVEIVDDEGEFNQLYDGEWEQVSE